MIKYKSLVLARGGKMTIFVLLLVVMGVATSKPILIIVSVILLFLFWRKRTEKRIEVRTFLDRDSFEDYLEKNLPRDDAAEIEVHEEEHEGLLLDYGLEPAGYVVKTDRYNRIHPSTLVDTTDHGGSRALARSLSFHSSPSRGDRALARRLKAKK